MDRMASQTAEVRFYVGLADFRFVAVPATRQNHLWLHSCVTLDEFRIAGIGVLDARPMTSFATTFCRVFALDGLSVCGF
jgi:hypothetical protein